MGHIQNPRIGSITNYQMITGDFSPQITQITIMGISFTTLPIFAGHMTGTQLQVVLYDCDDFTRKFYLDYLGLSDIAVLGQVMSVLSVFLIFYALQMA